MLADRGFGLRQECLAAVFSSQILETPCIKICIVSVVSALHSFLLFSQAMKIGDIQASPHIRHFHRPLSKAKNTMLPVKIHHKQLSLIVPETQRCCTNEGQILEETVSHITILCKAGCLNRLAGAEIDFVARQFCQSPEGALINGRNFISTPALSS